MDETYDVQLRHCLDISTNTSVEGTTEWIHKTLSR